MVRTDGERQSKQEIRPALLSDRCRRKVGASNVAISIDRSVGVGSLVIGLIGTGIVVLWPEKRWLGWVFLALAFLILLIAIVWALAVRHARKELQQHNSSLSIMPPIEQRSTQMANPHNEFNAKNEFSPKIEIHQNQGHAKTAMAAPKSFAEPHIEFTNPALGLYVVDAFNRLQPVDTDPNAMVMLARFYYKPERKVPPYLDVKALISIADEEGNPIKARYDGVWDGYYDSASIRFGTAETRSLVVALLPPPHINERDSIVTWGFGARLDGPRFNILSGFVPDKNVLFGGEFRLTIELVGKHRHEVVLHTTLNFRLNVRQQFMELV